MGRVSKRKYLCPHIDDDFAKFAICLQYIFESCTHKYNECLRVADRRGLAIGDTKSTNIDPKNRPTINHKAQTVMIMGHTGPVSNGQREIARIPIISFRLNSMLTACWTLFLKTSLYPQNNAPCT